ERIYWLYKPKGDNFIGEELKYKHALLTSVWRLPPEKENPHPAPFPIELPTRIIYYLLEDKKGIVIDPYCGSGTTLVAAKLLGHGYIGIDISKCTKRSQRKVF
ncbi:MAG: DNA methyltransferase, partial [Aquificaceae bacterium]